MNRATELSSRPWVPLLAALVLPLSGALLTAACGDRADGDGEGSGGRGGTGSGHAGEGGGTNFERPLYAMMIQVYDTEDRTVYAHLTDSLDLGEIELPQAREFASVANFVPYDGKLLVSSDLAPKITE